MHILQRTIFTTVEHSDTICITLSRFCNISKKRISYDLIRRRIKFTKDHWTEPNCAWIITTSLTLLILTFWDDKWRNCSRAGTKHTLNHLSGLIWYWRKGQGHRPLLSGSRNFQKGVNLFNIRILKVSLLSTASYASYLWKPRGSVQSPTSVRVQFSWEIHQGDTDCVTSVSVSYLCDYT